LHVHDVLEVGLCHRGHGVFVVEDKVLPFTAGCASVIGKREFHLARSSPGTTSHWSFHYLDPIALVEPCDDLDVARVCRLGGPSFPNVLDPVRHGDLCALVRQLDGEAWSRRPSRQAAISGLTQVLLALLSRLSGPIMEPSDRHDAVQRVAPALGAISAHFTEEIDVSDLAQACGMSITHFRRLFARALGQSPKEYLTRFRLQKAATLLGAGRCGVLDAALACGWGSLSAFSRQFRTVFGTSPRGYRHHGAASTTHGVVR
jgi:AraC-like DNA-binding protein